MYRIKKADAHIEEEVITGTIAAWHNRMKVNQLDGYYVVSDKPEVGEEGISHSLDASKVKSIIVCTDGIWRLFEDNHTKNIRRSHAPEC